ncbi:MAG TPA: sialate O-acetylesterase, partial [Flavisolibacter sp.]|nr:sialate O-acetylesterase [Flavisolibacter sp.]
MNFWGWSSPGEKIILTPSWQTKPVTINADSTGSWKLSLQTPPAGGPYRILLKGENEIELK